MNSWLKAASAMAAAMLLAAGPLAAQQETCDITTNSPNEMRTAMRQLALYQLGTGTPEQRRDYLRSALLAATERPDRFRANEVGRQYAIGQSLAYYAMDEETPLIARRGDLGFANDPEERIDIVQAMDEALSFVERERPGCRAELEGFRAQPWQRLLKHGVDVAAGGDTDSAVVLIRKANAIYDGLPHGHYYLAAVLQQAGREQEAAAAFRETMQRITEDMALEDTTLAELRDVSMFAVAMTDYDEAEKLTGADQERKMREVARAFEEHAEEFPESERAANSRIMQMNALAQSGDTAALNTARRDMLSRADEFTAVQLLEAGTHAFSSKDMELAIALLEKGIEKNPYSRPGLFNLSNAYWEAKQFDKMVGVARRLVEVDPNNSSNLEVLAVAMEGNARTIQNAQQRKIQMDSVTALVNRAQNLPVQLTFSPMTTEGDARVLNGVVTNNTNQARSVSIAFEFLDPRGQVVGRETKEVSLSPQGRESITVRVANRDAVGFRYPPIR